MNYIVLGIYWVALIVFSLGFIAVTPLTFIEIGRNGVTFDRIYDWLIITVVSYFIAGVSAYQLGRVL